MNLKVNIIRCFISADIPEEVRRYLASIQAELPRMSGVNFVPTDNLHVTLAFLGEIGEDAIGAVIAGTEDVARRTESIACFLGTIEAVPHHSPRLIWVTVSDNGRLKEIHGALKQFLNIQGREFNGHITLARIKSAGAARAISKKISEIKLVPTNFQISRISILESKLDPQGAIYSVIKAMNLRHE